ncbi:MAG: lysylphosphatidylglycerol synthase transmembrane domain-containing protein [Spirochaetota bacterium]
MKEKTKRYLFLILRISVSLLLLGIVIAFADLDKIYQSLVHFELSWLPAVFGFIILSVIISAWKWGLLLGSRNFKSIIYLFRIYVKALFFNNFLPSSIGGDGVRIILAGKYYGRTAHAAASVVVDRALAAVSLALLGIAGAAFATKPFLPAIGLMCVLFIAGVLATYILLTGWTPAFIKTRNGRISKSWISFSESACGLMDQPRALWFSLALSFVFQICVALVVASVMKGLGLPVPGAPDLFFITSASSVLAMAPVGLNGYGMREGAYIFLLQPLGYSISSALTVSVLFAVFVSIFSLTSSIDWILTRSNSLSNPKENITDGVTI